MFPCSNSFYINVTIWYEQYVTEKQQNIERIAAEEAEEADKAALEAMESNEAGEEEEQEAPAQAW